MRYGMMIDYKFCTGCHSCEMACKKHLNLERGQWGIKVFENGPWEISEGKWQYDFLPAPTNMCNLCADRRAEGKMASCVQHCQSDVITIAPVEELAAMADKDRMVIYVR